MGVKCLAQMVNMFNLFIVNNYFLLLIQALKFHISCDMTAEEVHNLGEKEVQRIRSRMDEVRQHAKLNETSWNSNNIK